MTIILCILAWLLSGFAGSYIGHRWADDSRLDTRLGIIIVMTLFGTTTLAGAIVAVIWNKIDSGMVVFKRKS
jgi:hypothetical protein